jgi:biofilm PGA synthesis N-glycosyltransferase PgaC
MVFLLILALVAALLAFPPLAYYAWMRNIAKKSWDITIDTSYQPTVTLIIPTYNEATVIDKKLENTQQIDYPRDKLQVILVDSASTDNTISVVRDFLKRNKVHFPIKLLAEGKRKGKSHALNTALKYAKGEIIAISDADSFWEPDVLRKSVPFFADLSVGAITGREKLINLKQSLNTQSEGLYRNFYYTLRLGESKVHSTLIFQGELSLYRRSVLEKFEDRAGYSDDTGTVINIVSRGYRCIFVPEAVFHDTAAYSLSSRLRLKSRRAQHLVAGLIESLKIKTQGRLPLPSAIVLFNFHMHITSPFILLFAAFIFVLYLPTFWYLLPIVIFPLLFKKSRVFIFSYLTSNLALIAGLIHHLIGKKEVTWRKIDEMRRV